MYKRSPEPTLSVDGKTCSISKLTPAEVNIVSPATGRVFAPVIKRFALLLFPEPVKLNGIKSITVASVFDVVKSTTLLNFNLLS
jgi:hypothetical protein